MNLFGIRTDPLFKTIWNKTINPRRKAWQILKDILQAIDYMYHTNNVWWSWASGVEHELKSDSAKQTKRKRFSFPQVIKNLRDIPENQATYHLFII